MPSNRNRLHGRARIDGGLKQRRIKIIYAGTGRGGAFGEKCDVLAAGESRGGLALDPIRIADAAAANEDRAELADDRPEKRIARDLLLGDKTCAGYEVQQVRVEP